MICIYDMYIYFGVWYGVVMCNMLISHVFFIWHLKSMLGRLNANQASFGIVLGACANGGSSFLRGRTVEVLEWWTDARAAVLESCVVLEWVPCGQDLVVAASALRQMQRQSLRTDWESTVLPCTSTAVFKFRSTCLKGTDLLDSLGTVFEMFWIYLRSCRWRIAPQFYALTMEASQTPLILFSTRIVSKKCIQQRESMLYQRRSNKACREVKSTARSVTLLCGAKTFSLHKIRDERRLKTVTFGIRTDRLIDWIDGIVVNAPFCRVWFEANQRLAQIRSDLPDWLRVRRAVPSQAVPVLTYARLNVVEN